MMLLKSFKKWTPYSLLLAILICGSHVSTAVAQPQQEDIIDEIAAVVGEYIVLKSEVDGIVLRLMQTQQMPYSEEVWYTALNQMIDQRALTIHAKRDTNIIVSDDQLEQVLQQRVDQLTAQVGGTAQFEELYGKSSLEIKADLREELRDQLMAEQFQGQKINGIKITPTEIRDWFSQFPTDSLPTIPEVVRISHIVRYPEITDEAREEAIELISTIRDSIVVAGWSMEEMATNFTDDAGSAQNGGRYESSKLRELVPEFAAVASRSPIGEVSDVFESPYGYHILRVNERKGDVVDFTHILIQIDEDKADPTDAIELLSQVQDSILTYDIPFELMARRHSEEDISNRIGGRVLDMRSGERDLVLQALDFSWRSTINSINVGEISEPSKVELLDGKQAYHIVYLHRRIPEHTVDIETDYERIQQLALQDKQNRVLQAWIEELRKGVYIEMRGKARDISLALNASRN